MPFRARLALYLLSLLLAASPVRAQDDPSAVLPDSLMGWMFDLSGKLSASQVALRNWQEGGVNTLAFTSGLTGLAMRGTERWGQVYDLRLSFGVVQQDDEAIRKSVDLIRFNAVLRYRGDGFFRLFEPTFAAGVRTQFAPGFNFDENPFPEGTPQNPDGAPLDDPIRTSQFFAPAILTQTLGLTYQPVPWSTIRVGVATKQTVVTAERLRVLYGNADVVETQDGGVRLVNGRDIRFEAGVEAKTEVDREVAENVRAQSSVIVFTAYNQEGSAPDITFENIITMRVNSWLNTQLEFTTILDRNITDAAQIRQALSVGIAFVII